MVNKKQQTLAGFCHTCENVIDNDHEDCDHHASMFKENTCVGCFRDLYYTKTPEDEYLDYCDRVYDSWKDSFYC